MTRRTHPMPRYLGTRRMLHGSLAATPLPQGSETSPGAREETLAWSTMLVRVCGGFLVALAALGTLAFATLALLEFDGWQHVLSTPAPVAFPREAVGSASVPGLTAEHCHNYARFAAMQVWSRQYGGLSHAEARQRIVSHNAMIREHGTQHGIAETLQTFLIHENLAVVDAAHTDPPPTAEALAAQTLKRCAQHLPS